MTIIDCCHLSVMSEMLRPSYDCRRDMEDQEQQSKEKEGAQRPEDVIMQLTQVTQRCPILEYLVM